MKPNSLRNILLAATCLILPKTAPAQTTITGLSTLSNQSLFDGTILTNNLAAQATITGTTPSLGSLPGLVDGEGSPIGLGDTSANLTNDGYFDGSAALAPRTCWPPHPQSPSRSTPTPPLPATPADIPSPVSAASMAGTIMPHFPTRIIRSPIRPSPTPTSSHPWPR